MAQFCSNCGSMLPDNVKFCENCGARCAAIPPRQTTQPAPQPAPQSEPQSAPQSAPQSDYSYPSAPKAQPDPQRPSEYAEAPMLRPGPMPQQPSSYPPQQPSYGDSYQQPAPPMGAPINSRQPYYAVPQAPGAPEEKSHLGLGIAITVITVLLIAAAIVVFFIWKPFDKKDDSSSDTAPTTATEATLPGETEAPSAATDTPTEAPTAAPTDTPASTDSLTATDEAEIRQKFSTIVDYGYSPTKADVGSYLAMTFDYVFAKDASIRQDMYDSLQEYFFDDIDELSEQYGTGYVLSCDVTSIEPYSVEDTASELEYYADDVDVSRVEMIVKVHASVTITGSLGSDTEGWGWTFIKVDGAWYPEC